MPKRKMKPREGVSPLDATWYASRFKTDFIYDRPFGAGDEAIHLFHFRNEISLLDGDGEGPRAAGSAILYPPNVPQRFQGIASSEKPVLCDHVAFPAGSEVRLGKLGIPLNQGFTIANPQPVMDSILSIRSEERNAHEHWRSATRAYRTVLMLQLAREVARDAEASTSPRDTHGEELIRDICAMIDRNPAHAWVVADLAETVNMSRGRFTALFKEVTGVAPQEYAINARLHEVRVMLTNTSLTVAEIAERCGFSSAYYLSRLFSNRVGCPPSRYAERFRLAAE